MKRISVVALLLTLLLSSTMTIALADSNGYMGSGTAVAENSGMFGSGTAAADTGNTMGSGLAVEDGGGMGIGSGG